MGSVVRRKGGPPALPPVAVAALPPGSDGGSPSPGGGASDVTPRSTPQFTPGNTPGAPRSLASGATTPMFDSLASEEARPGPAAAAPQGDAVIAMASGQRSPPRELAVPQGSELERRLSDPAMLAAAAAQRAQQQQEQEP